MSSLQACSSPPADAADGAVLDASADAGVPLDAGWSFVERFDGDEQEVAFDTAFAVPLASDVTYAVRFRVQQEAPTTTRLRARVWPLGEVEPTTWRVAVTDTTPSLQNVSGGMAVDSYSSVTSGTLTYGTRVDDIEATVAQ